MTAGSLLSAAARRLNGKVAVITGGASGIGECTARLFARHGAKLVVADVQTEKGRAVCDDIGATFVQCDVASESDVKKVVDTAVELYGKLDVMFNNAGILGPLIRTILDTDTCDFKRVLATNILGPFHGTKHAARVMIPQGKGSIIATTSVCSVVGGSGTYPYTASKHGLLGLVKDAALELGAHGIRVNSVSPYGVATPFSLAAMDFKMAAEEMEKLIESTGKLKGAILKAEDVANSVLFLASDDSKYVNGHNLVVDGGFTVA